MQCLSLPLKQQLSHLHTAIVSNYSDSASRNLRPTRDRGFLNVGMLESLCPVAGVDTMLEASTDCPGWGAVQLWPTLFFCVWEDASICSIWRKLNPASASFTEEKVKCNYNFFAFSVCLFRSLIPSVIHLKQKWFVYDVDYISLQVGTPP